MKLRGLRSSLALNFLLFLAVGMLLINFVVISLWHQHHLQVNLSNLQTQLKILKNSDFINCSSSIVVKNSLAELFDQETTSLYLIVDDKVVFPEKYQHSELITILNYSSISGIPNVQKIGYYWSGFLLGVKKIIITEPVVFCKKKGSIGLVVRTDELYRSINKKQSLIYVYLLVNGIILTTLYFFRMRRVVVKPLENLVKLSETYGKSQNELLVVTSKDNEFGSVALALQSMLLKIEKDKEKLKNTIISLEEANKQILDNQKAIVDAEKMAALGRIAAGLAHEIGNPLGIIQGYLELLESNDLEEIEKKQFIEKSSKELSRVDRLIRQLLDYSKTKVRIDEKTEVFSVLKDTIDILKPQKAAKNIEISIEKKENLPLVNIDKDGLHQVFLNCMLNAIDGINEKNFADGKIEVSCCIDGSAEYLEILIKDNGVGISEDTVSVVFDPFFSTKEVGMGTGLGLSVSRSIIEALGGKINLDSRINVGTTVSITIPINQKSEK